MALVVADRVRETTAVTGTGSATLLGAVVGYQTFATIGDINTTIYCIVVQNAAEWETGIGTYNVIGATLSRDTVLASSNAGALVSFSAGTKDVFVICPVEKVAIDAYLQDQKYTAFTTAGTATAFTLTPVPALSAYMIGVRFFITLHAAVGDNPTINISGLGDLGFKCYYQSGYKVYLNSNQAPLGWSSDCFYDGTDMVMVNIVPGSVASAFTQKALFGYGINVNNIVVSLTNQVSNTGVVATDTTGIGTTRWRLAAAGYGLDKAIFGFGATALAAVSITNLVSNTGVVATDTTGVGTERWGLGAASYGLDKVIFGYGDVLSTAYVSMTNLVSNTGVVATDTTGVGTARHALAAVSYGSDKAIFGYGTTSSVTAVTNLVSNTGDVATDTTGVGTARQFLAAAGYDKDKALFGYGYTTTYVSMTNLVSNIGVVATDTTGVGTERWQSAAAGYGLDKAIFGYGDSLGGILSLSNLVSNTGVVATDTTGVGTARRALAAAGFSGS